MSHTVISRACFGSSVIFVSKTNSSLNTGLRFFHLTEVLYLRWKVSGFKRLKEMCQIKHNKNSFLFTCTHPYVCMHHNTVWYYKQNFNENIVKDFDFHMHDAHKKADVFSEVQEWLHSTKDYPWSNAPELKK